MISALVLGAAISVVQCPLGGFARTAGRIATVPARVAAKVATAPFRISARRTIPAAVLYVVPVAVSVPVAPPACAGGVCPAR